MWKTPLSAKIMLTSFKSAGGGAEMYSKNNETKIIVSTLTNEMINAILI